MVMMARTNLSRHDLFFMTMGEIKLIHDTMREEKREMLGHYYHIADQLAVWMVKSGTGLEANFRRKNLNGELIPNPIIKKQPQKNAEFSKDYNNALETEKILKIWKLDPQNINSNGTSKSR